MGGAEHDALSHALMGNDRLPGRHMVGHTYGSAGQRGERGQRRGVGRWGGQIKAQIKASLEWIWFLKNGRKTSAERRMKEGWKI